MARSKAPSLIKVSELKDLIASGETPLATAIHSDTGGHVLHIQVRRKQYVLATYLGQQRLFKRADALLKESRSIGFTEVRFPLT